jgi:hypothetical protein
VRGGVLLQPRAAARRAQALQPVCPAGGKRPQVSAERFCCPVGVVVRAQCMSACLSWSGEGLRAATVACTMTQTWVVCRCWDVGLKLPSGATVSIRTTVPDGFPHEPPMLHIVQRRATHPWLDSYQRVVCSPEVNTWNATKNLGHVGANPPRAPLPRSRCCFTRVRRLRRPMPVSVFRCLVGCTPSSRFP